MTKTRLAVIAAFVALLGGAVWASSAGAYQCTTSCNPTVRTCTTICN